MRIHCSGLPFIDIGFDWPIMSRYWSKDCFDLGFSVSVEGRRGRYIWLSLRISGSVVGRSVAVIVEGIMLVERSEGLAGSIGCYFRAVG